MKPDFKKILDEFNPVTEEQQKAFLTEIDSFQQIDSQKQNTGFGRHYQNATFESFKTNSNNQELILKECIKYADMSKCNGESFILYGNVGNGKTHLISAICKQMKESYIVTDLMELSELKRYCQQTNLNWLRAIDQFCNSDVLVLPDFEIRQDKDGIFNLSESQKEMMFYIVKKLYNENKSIIIGTNLSMKDFKIAIEFKGLNRVTSRLRSMCKNRILYCCWEDYRK
jgi:DNA replication protein DnaC